MHSDNDTPKLTDILNGREYLAEILIDMSYASRDVVAITTFGYIRRPSGICRLVSKSTGTEWKRVITSKATDKAKLSFECVLARYTQKCTVVVYLSPRRASITAPANSAAISRGRLGGSIGGKVQSKAKIAAYKRNFAKRWK